MGNISSYYADKVLNALLEATTLTSPTTVYLALFTTQLHFEDDIGSGPTEVSGGSYARQAITFGTAASLGLTSNSAVVTFPTPTANWGMVVATALCDASSSGHIIFWDNICPQAVNTGTAAATVQIDGWTASMGIA